jgi:hypothetical protein
MNRIGYLNSHSELKSICALKSAATEIVSSIEWPSEARGFVISSPVSGVMSRAEGHGMTFRKLLGQNCIVHCKVPELGRLYWESNSSWKHTYIYFKICLIEKNIEF